ncbi:hypothetical protein KXR94_04160 [Stutzerimonas stutzeri]
MPSRLRWSLQSNPNIIHGRPLVGFLACIQHTQLCFARRAGFVFDAFLHYIHVTGANRDLTVAKFDHRLGSPDMARGKGFAVFHLRNAEALMVQAGVVA